MTTAPDDWWSAVNHSVASGAKILHSAEEFDAATAHVLSLLKDASTLLASGSAATATFLAVAALEETVKIHIGSFRQASDGTPRRRDPLFQHSAKHRLAAAPTIEMGSRLGEAIGQERLTAILEEARTGGLVKLREDALYFDHDGQTQHIPAKAIDHARARELLLFAIEVFDDSLIGSTRRSYDLGREAEAIFNRWK